MTKTERLIRASHLRMMLYQSLSVFNACEDWKKYIEYAMMIHELEDLIKELEKE